MSAVPQPLSEPLLSEGGAAAECFDPLLAALQLALEHHGIRRSTASLRAGLPPMPRLDAAAFVRAAETAGCGARAVQRRLRDIPGLVLPVVLVMRDGSAVLLRERRADDGACLIAVPGTAPPEQWIAGDELERHYAGQCFFLKPRRVATVDEGAEAAARPVAGHWLWGTLWRYRGLYAEAALAALLVNVLTLAGTFFVMNVYDRVIANQAYVTLWTLAIGVSVAIVFEFLARVARSTLIDSAGRKADLVIGARLFQQALATRLEHRPASAGAYASQLREFEALRDFASSVTLVALTDLPFLLLFIAVIAAIAGPLAWIPVVMVPVVAIAAGLAQWPLARYVRENLQESTLRHGLLVESLAAADTIKALGAEGLMQGRYEGACAATSATAMRSRHVTQLVLNFCNAAQSLSTVAMVVWGSYLIAAGSLSLGALIGAVILASRSIAPLGGLAALAVRFQQARSALTTLDAVMARPVDRDPSRQYLRLDAAVGALSVHDLEFRYGEAVTPAVAGIRWSVDAGERVGVIGRVGSGKSTLLRLLGGLYQPGDGQVLLDGIELRQLDPVDVRRHVVYVGQDAPLLQGTLRDNLEVGLPWIGDARRLEVCRATGVDALAAADPRGYDMRVGEGGRTLSGGQRQLVALTRALLATPAVLLLDEPTSAMDHASEQQVLQALFALCPRSTVVLVTHKLQLLNGMTRVAVLENGRMVADGPRPAVLQALAEGRVRANTAAAAATAPAAVQAPPERPR
ncbi:MAG: type I secretion system permease/ATPase [Sinobacteraceae bacterium]|nr:type I secretion system permease/ATPase [Nevskiaceae bacterium]MCP5339599.1 type I secretion system permease/ATPase [Nevskiaceae bacterium]MCP5472931.1 type I secretion system permease/ATPase [Nevskiaceae bacterium]